MRARHVIECTIDPKYPVDEVMELIQELLLIYPVQSRKQLLQDIDDAIGNVLAKMEEIEEIQKHETKEKQ